MSKTSLDKKYAIKLDMAENFIKKKDTLATGYNVTWTIYENQHARALFATDHATINWYTQVISCLAPLTGNYGEMTLTGNNIEYDFHHQVLETAEELQCLHPQFLIKAHKSKIDIKSQELCLSNGVYSEFLPRSASNRGSN